MKTTSESVSEQTRGHDIFMVVSLPRATVADGRPPVSDSLFARRFQGRY
jgi:hypothetical protein